MAKTVKVRFAAYAQNMGDSEMAIRIYRRRDIAEVEASFDHSRTPGDIIEHELEVDCATGEIIVGHRVTPDSPEPLQIKGRKFVFTGTLSHYTRTAVTALIHGLGGKVLHTVSRNVDILVVGSKPGSNLDKAAELGIRTMNQREFELLLRNQQPHA